MHLVVMIMLNTKNENNKNVEPVYQKYVVINENLICQAEYNDFIILDHIYRIYSLFTFVVLDTPNRYLKATLFIKKVFDIFYKMVENVYSNIVKNFFEANNLTIRINWIVTKAFQKFDVKNVELDMKNVVNKWYAHTLKNEKIVFMNFVPNYFYWLLNYF